MQARSLGWEDPLDEGMTTHSCLENSMDREEPGGLQSPRVGHDWSDLAHIHRLSSVFCSVNLLHASRSLPLCQLAPYLWQEL